MKKKLLFALTVTATFMFIPNVFAYTNEQGTVSNITDSDTLVGSITVNPEAGENDKTKYMRFKDATFNFVPADPSNPAGNRKENYAWVGIKVSYPSGVSQTGYKVYVDDILHNDNSTINEGVRETDSYKEWFGISEARLLDAIKNNQPIRYELSFDWDGTGEKKDQIVIIEIDPMTITVYPTKEAATTASAAGNKEGALWTPEIAKETKAKLLATVSQPEKKQPENQESNPDTADINLLNLLALIIASGLGLTYSVKKAKQN